jgi:signal transduction histidine kinase
MGWTNLAILGVGLGIGAVGGWLVGRSQSNRFLSTASKSVIPDQPTSQQPVDEVATTPKFDPEKQALAEQLQRTQLAYWMAVEMAQFKAGFLARTSHELRSPINSVISLHQLILSDLCEDPAEEREFVAQAYAAAEKMLALLDRLISIAKAGHGAEQLQLQPLQLQEVLEEVQQFTQLQAQNRNLRLVIEKPDPNLYVLADSRWLRQVLVSLIDTPISLMQDGYIRVTTGVFPEAQQVQVWIEDERPVGFWSEAIDLLDCLDQRIEKPNLKPDLQLESRSPSPGLTLLINQTLLELMGGRLTVVAAPPLEASQERAASGLTRIQCTLPLSL